MSYFTALKRELENYLDLEDIQEIEKAYIVARDAHRGQKRQSGEAYITHPVAAAVIMAELRMDSKSIMAALLHDVLEDTPVSKVTLIQSFGTEVAELVDGVSKLEQIKFSSKAEAQAESFRKMVLAMVQDIRVILVKLADRLHNMRTLGALSFEKRRRKAKETLEIYAPIANRLGIHSWYVELEDLGFKALYPNRYEILEKAVERIKGNRKKILDIIEENLSTALAKHKINSFEVKGRQKHLYSIYKKMKSKQMSFSEIMDVYGFRIVVDDPDTCYRVLGVIHRLYKPITERFKDYIAIPKLNSYQSLHTSLFGPYGVPIEVQIRTENMHKVAEKGIASHWLYKTTGLDADEAQSLVHEWMKGLVEMQQRTGNSLEFVESVKIDLFPHEVYVFTPDGDIKKLPKGATPVDFAYAVHSDIGNTCIGAKINKQFAPLSMPLVNGQRVEIITSKDATPNAAWLNFVVTGKARSSIRHFLKNQQHAASVSLGERMLNQALSAYHILFDDIPADNVDELISILHYRTVEDLFAGIGKGDDVAQVVASRLLNAEFSQTPSSLGPIYIKGTEGVAVRFADCCRPIPGDTIVGYVHSGHGIVVHLEQCTKISKFRHDPQKLIYMCWEDNASGEFKVDVILEVKNHRRVLAIMAGVIADADSNIDNIIVSEGDGQTLIVSLTITVKNRKHLASVMRQLRVLPFMVRLYRKK